MRREAKWLFKFWQKTKKYNWPPWKKYCSMLLGARVWCFVLDYYVLFPTWHLI